MFDFIHISTRIMSLLEEKLEKWIGEIEKIEEYTLKMPDNFGMIGKTIKLIKIDDILKKLKE